MHYPLALMNKWVKNDPVRLFSCNIFVIMSSYHFRFQLFLKKLVFDVMSFRISTYLLYISRNMIFVLLPQVSISGSKMIHMHFLWNLMGTFDSYQLWLSGTYSLSTTKIVPEV